jgi:hypothetical protein
MSKFWNAMKNRFTRLFAIAGILSTFGTITGCAVARGTATGTGPGMVVNFSNVLPGRTVHFLSVRTPNGTSFSNPGSLSSSPTPFKYPVVMGAAPDGRALPEWVEFTWREPAYPAVGEFNRAEFNALPQKSERVPIRARVPQDVVDEVIASRQRGGTGNKRLWLYLLWREDGIKLAWSLKQDCCTVLRKGGDRVD